MLMRKFCLWWLFTLLSACGGSTSTGKSQDSTTAALAAPLKVESKKDTPCTRPIEAPKDVWQRVEAARALSEQELIASCGLPFVEVISEWRSPPVDLLAPIVRDNATNGQELIDWVTQKADGQPRAAISVAAMNILGEWRIGDETAAVEQRFVGWKSVIAQYGTFDSIAEDMPSLIKLLPLLKEIHELRCMLEVNPLGFAVSCSPIHPAKEKIDLTWQEEIQDGLIRNLSLSKCKESRYCPKLMETSRVFFAKYQAALQQAEQLKTEVFKDQTLEWLKLKPFSQGAK